MKQNDKYPALFTLKFSIVLKSRIVAQSQTLE